MSERMTDEVNTDVDSYLQKQSDETLHNLSLSSDFGWPITLPASDPTRIFNLDQDIPEVVSVSAAVGAQVGTGVSPLTSQGVPVAANKRFWDREGDKLSTAEKKSIALWMASEAQKRGFPPELPVMAALTETGDKLINLLDGDKDSQGFFQIRPSSNGLKAVESPEAQLRWFLYTATRSPLGRTARTNNWTMAIFLDQITAARAKNDEGALSLWLGRWCQDIERSAYPDRYEQRYVRARKLLYG